MMRRNLQSHRLMLLAITMGALCGSLLSDPARGQSSTSLIFHSTMDDAAAIHQPEISQATYPNESQTIVSPGVISYVAGQFDTAARFATSGGAWDGKVKLKGENFDFDDPDQDGGRLDMWIRFDEDPHSVANVFVMSEWTGTRNMNFELTGSPSAMMLDCYGEVPASERTNFQKFRVNPRDEQTWQSVATGEWHLYTWLWRNNGDQHKDEIHYYIDGVHVGSDFNGNLAVSVDSFPYMGLAPGSSGGIAMTLDEIYSFDSWNLDGVNGNFASLQIPEGVTLTYPMDKDYPTWGEAVPVRNIDFAFYVVDDQNPSCDCDIYIDDALAGTVTTQSRAYTEFPSPFSLTDGTHSFQVKCDGDRLVSETTQFNVDSNEVPVDTPSMSRVRGFYKPKQ